MRMERVLIIGRGGREHALAWKLAQSPRVERVWVAPGNGGTALAGGKVANVDLQEGDFAGLIEFAQGNGVTLTVVGPEAPLADGIVDAFQAAGLRCFGPSKAAAQIEASKAFAKDFMARYGIPTARHATFTDFDAALAHLQKVEYPVVLKASGLAAGKGVILPASLAEAGSALRQIMVEREFGAAGDAVVIEERLAGPEASVLAFSDGRTVALMPAAQDHKRVFDDDQGPNTGGMGAYAPAPLMTGLAAGHRRAGGRGHALHRRALCRHDADGGWPQDARVQLPFRRPRDPGHPASVGERPGRRDRGLPGGPAGRDGPALACRRSGDSRRCVGGLPGQLRQRAGDQRCG